MQDALDKGKAIIEPILSNIDQSFADVTPLTKLCESFKIRVAYLVLPLFLIAVISLGTGIFSNIFVAIVGMIYPAYQTYRVHLSLNQAL